MGRQKLLLPFAEGTLLDRAIAACNGFPIIVVTSTAVAMTLERTSGIVLIIDDEPARGMTHPLRLASAEIATNRALIVLPADLPLVTNVLVQNIAAAPPADVVYPVSHSALAIPCASAHAPVLAYASFRRATRYACSETKTGSAGSA